MRQVILLLASLFFCHLAYSQFKITGTVKDANGGPLIGASIVIEQTYQGTTSNSSGEFVFPRLRPGNYMVQASYMGYESERKEVRLDEDKIVNFVLDEKNILGEEIIVTATRFSGNIPGAGTIMQREEIEERNLAQDIPYLLELTPSVVATSDAGTGVGYTNLRIRGTDSYRINVTMNGIPLNDSESHGVWWVNMPDFASSVENLQVQRGVGTSTQGAAAFGGTINFQTFSLNQEPYGEVNVSGGSFNTFKRNVRVGTGLINNSFSFDARFSKIDSDGYIDRAFADLSSFYISGAWYSKRSVLKFNILSGKEVTYQAWYGVEQSLLETNRTHNPYTYDNETDNYEQTHYQLLYSYEILPSLNFNGALHYTKGAGYYEQYRNNQRIADYGIELLQLGDTIINRSDLIRRKWLDNDFMGFTYSLNYKQGKTEAILGGGYNVYEGDHFGHVIWARYAADSEIRHKYYDNIGSKQDFNIFGKVGYQLLPSVNVFGDIQYRYIHYNVDGVDDYVGEDGLPVDITQSHEFNFINPKVGMSYKPSPNHETYLTFSVGNREPTRSNYLDAPTDDIPVNETLYNYELGYIFSSSQSRLGVNIYYMDYDNQLVHTGKLNDVGAPIMTNVPDSYRAGVEFMGGIRLFDFLRYDLNLTLSRNKIKRFVEYADHFDADWNYLGNLPRELGETDIAYSPNIISASNLRLNITENIDVAFISKYVGPQYFDNTMSDARQLDGYFVNDLRFSFEMSPRFTKNIRVQFLINNIFNEMYESNAYGGNWYEAGSEQTWAYYFPQAGRNFLAGISMLF